MCSNLASLSLLLGYSNGGLWACFLVVTSVLIRQYMLVYTIEILEEGEMESVTRELTSTCPVLLCRTSNRY